MTAKQQRYTRGDTTDAALQQMGRAVIRTEAEGVNSMLERIDEHFVAACRLMLACNGRVIVTGMGKSGHVAGKIASTLASTGTPAFFVHPGEASHGDLGMITDEDVVIAVSYSGETAELLTIVPLVKRQGVPLIALTGNASSTLAKWANVHINVSVDKEACPLGLAPTSSTTATLVMGDALAIALLEARGFTEEDFAKSHPGGSLGRRLLLLIEDIMHTGDAVPRVTSSATVRDALSEISKKGLGFTTVVDDANVVVGLFTDGDLRRLLDQVVDVRTTPITDVMIRNCKTLRPTMLAAEALENMEKYKVNAFPVTDDNRTLLGALNMHDLLRAGVV